MGPLKPATAIGMLLAGLATAQYRPLAVPAELEFRQPTAAFDPADPAKKLGEFQPGITVHPLESDPNHPLWRVLFKRYGAPDIESLVPAPDLSVQRAEAFSRVESHIAGFPLLQRMLEADEPWPDDLYALAANALGDASEATVAFGSEADPGALVAGEPGSFPAWGLQPLKVLIRRNAPERPSLLIEFWNKGDAYRTALNPSSARRDLEDHLGRIQSAFRAPIDDPLEDKATAAIRAIRSRETVFLLPNDLRVALKYAHGEYLNLEIESVSKLKTLRTDPYNPATFRENLLARVATNGDGFRYINGIPMIDQGDKGYCAAATLARVLNHYGYPVDQHDIARLAETEAQLGANDRGGTLRDDIVSAMRRVCAGTPFRLEQLKEATPAAILGAIESGTPIIWFVPGHARLLIGMHPETNAIVYSDSYGAGHEFSVASWDYFYNANVEMWLLTPTDLR